MDDFVRTVGERSLSKLYNEATTLIAKGSGIKNVFMLKNVLIAMDLVIEPLSTANMEYKKALSVIRKDLKDAELKEAKRAIIDSAPLMYSILCEWFRNLNYVVDDNNLLFATSSVYQETYSDKYEGGDENETAL